MWAMYHGTATWLKGKRLAVVHSGSGRYQKTGTYMPVTYEHVLMALNTDILCLSCVQKYLCALLFPQKVVCKAS